MPVFLTTTVGIVVSFGALLLLGTVLALVLTRTPYIPTPLPIVRTMIDLAKLRGTERIYDLGCGDGRLLFEAKQAHPNIAAVGYEISPYPFLKGWLLNMLGRNDVTLKFESFMRANLADADVIFLYLLPSAMRALETKFAKELRPGTRVISHGFRFTNRTHSEVLDFKKRPTILGLAHPQRTPMLYLYRW